jgi:hypothetical protein
MSIALPLPSVAPKAQEHHSAVSHCLKRSAAFGFLLHGKDSKD